MKFAQELEDHAVPEWTSQYLDYKGAKKRIKAVVKAIRSTTRSSVLADRRQDVASTGRSPLSSLRDGPVRSLFTRAVIPNQVEHTSESPASPLDLGLGAASRSRTRSAASQPIPVDEHSPIFSTSNPRHDTRLTRYGSIIGSPDDSSLSRLYPAWSLELPDPALNVVKPSTVNDESNPADQVEDIQQATPISSSKAQVMPDAMDMSPSRPYNLARRAAVRPLASPICKTPSFLSRMMPSASPTLKHSSESEDVALENYRQVDTCKAEFFMFLDRELLKIESFYKTRENEATQRLVILREQLHIMRNHRLKEMLLQEHSQRHDGSDTVYRGPNNAECSTTGHKVATKLGVSGDKIRASVDNAHQRIGAAVANIRSGHVGKTTQAMKDLATPPLIPKWQSVNNDYGRKPLSAEVSYRTAKRRLKTALVEYYRGLELLKSYTLLNRVAFRKINKKYDKLVKPTRTLVFVNEKVTNAYFVTSELVDVQIRSVEDLYARYFERGNHKVAVGKLRAKTTKAGDFNASTFRSGFMIAGGTIFGVQALVQAVQQELGAPDVVVRSYAASLLQIYAGWFLILLMALFFCIDASMFTKERINFQFIFEFDTRRMLDWKQLCEIPALFYLLLGFIMWLNFSRFMGETIYVYWPVILTGLIVALLILPVPTLYHRSRRWFLFTCWRLLCSGLYPVEFRDFFSGDILCSLTYAMGNVELFFCLYAGHWRNPSVCSSGQSRLLGFLTTLPGIFRLLQCARRYYDTREWFPHAVNGGKYTFTILYYMSLSLYRINHVTQWKAFFIFAAATNACYCVVWDLVMDWSFTLNARRSPPFLREVRGFRHNLWLYYLALVVDPIVRFNWILYAIFTENAQHSAYISFIVALSEVARRGLWILLRIENEHCTNVSKFRAHRDVALPYDIENEDLRSLSHPQREGSAKPAQYTKPVPTSAMPASQTQASVEDTEQGVRPGTPAIASPVARALRRAGSTMLIAHAKDYERKKPNETRTEFVDESDDDDEVEAEEEEESRLAYNIKRAIP